MTSEMEDHVDPLERDHSLCVVLPEGLKKNITVHGSKPVMDVLVMLCASYRLNLPDYTVEFLSPNKNNISFKPNSPIGSLEAEQIVLRPRGAEEKPKKPYMPEATVRLLINYNTSHKTVVRVNPTLPLETLLPAVCDKCDFNVQTTVLLRDSQSNEPLDLTKSLNDHGLREVFARDKAAEDACDDHLRAADTAAVTPTEVLSRPLQDVPKKAKKQKSRGFFSIFRRRRKPECHGTVSAPSSPGLSKRAGVGVNPASVSFTNTLPAEAPQKRRAPPPPVSQSVPSDLSSCPVNETQKSAESTVRSTKRRAPPPPCTNTHEEQSARTDANVSLNSLEELKKTAESCSVRLSPPSSSSPHSSQAQPSSSSRPSLTHLHQVADSFMPSFRGKDLSDARSALARVLTSSLSKGLLVTRLRNSAAFPNFPVSSYMPTTPQRPDDGGFCSEHESVLKAHLPTENEWEDPVQRRQLTTFQVVPHNKTCDSESTVVPHQNGVSTGSSPAPEVSPETEKNIWTEGDSCSPGTSESRTRSPSPESSTSSTPLCDVDDQNSSDVIEEQKEDAVVMPAATSGCSDGETPISSEGQGEFLHSPRADMERCGSRTDEKEAKDVVDEEEDACFPPPPPPIFFNEDLETTKTEKDTSTSSTLPSLDPKYSTSNRHGDAFTEAHGDAFTEAHGDAFTEAHGDAFTEAHGDAFTEAHGDALTSAERSLNETNAGLSRFAQAVALAVRRSRLQSSGKGSEPQASSRFPSPPRSTYQYGA